MLALVAAVGVLVVGATVGTGVPMIDDTARSVVSAGEDIASGPTVNETEVAQEIHDRVNEVRQQRGLEPLSWEPALHEIATAHSEDMANRSYYAHESPEGNNFEDRYAQAGYNCRVESRSGQGYGGAENIAYTYATTDVEGPSGETVNHNGNETKIAHGIVNQWMNSPRHREILLQPFWNVEGIGVAVTEDSNGTKVLATQNFC